MFGSAGCNKALKCLALRAAVKLRAIKCLALELQQNLKVFKKKRKLQVYSMREEEELIFKIILLATIDML